MQQSAMQYLLRCWDLLWWSRTLHLQQGTETDYTSGSRSVTPPRWRRSLILCSLLLILLFTLCMPALINGQID